MDTRGRKQSGFSSKASASVKKKGVEINRGLSCLPCANTDSISPLLSRTSCEPRAGCATLNWGAPSTEHGNYAAAVVTLRSANDSITRVTPLMIMLTPTRTPIAQAELDGHCM